MSYLKENGPEVEAPRVEPIHLSQGGIQENASSPRRKWKVRDQMVKSTPNPKKPTLVGRIMYSAVGLSLIGGAVAALGAPFKWVLPHWF
jgi:hypothetical protein